MKKPSKPVTGARASEVPEDAKAILIGLLAAIESANYSQFIAYGDAGFKASLSEQQFSVVSGAVSPRLKKGYRSVSLGDLRQQGYKVYLWALRFTDAGDDLLVLLSLKDGTVGGFSIQ